MIEEYIHETIKKIGLKPLHEKPIESYLNRDFPKGSYDYEMKKLIEDYIDLEKEFCKYIKDKNIKFEKLWKKNL